MERLKAIKEGLISSVESQMGNLNCVDTEELGEAIDMIKDMSEAIYYCSIAKAMEERKEEEELMTKMQTRMPMQMPMSQPRYFSEPPYYHMQRDMDRDYGRMYYPGGNSSGNRGGGISSGGDGGSRNYSDGSYPMEIRDAREGRSSISRKNYMEAKELHHGTPAQMRELEKYLHELSQDITEMIQDASPEEKAVLQQKLSTLATKIK